MTIVRNFASPAGGANLVAGALADLRPLPHNQDLLGGAAINLSQPLPVFMLQLSEVAAGFRLEDAKLVGWRYLLVTPGSASGGYADIRQNKEGEYGFSGLANNCNATRLIDATRRADDLAKQLPSDCEPRILDAPAFKFSALWLFCGDSSLFLPYIDGSFRGGSTMPAITRDDLTKRFIEAAPGIRSYDTDLQAPIAG